MTHKAISVVMCFSILFASIVSMLSCHTASSDQDLLDSVNDSAYREKYVSVEKSKYCLKRWLARMGKRHDRAEMEEMRLNLGGVYALEMNYDSAKACLEEVIETTSNDLHRAMGDVDMMSVCLVTSMNKDFYDYRSDALERFANIKEERGNMTPRQVHLWNVVSAKYHMVSFNYFKRMGQDDAMMEELAWFDDNVEILSADTLLYSNYLLIKSVSTISSSHTEEERTLALRQLVHLLYMSHQNGFAYFEILASNALARYMASGGELKPSLNVLIEELINVRTRGYADGTDVEGTCSTDLYMTDDVAYLLASHALTMAQNYRNMYLTSMVRCTMSSIALRHGDKQSALIHALCALDLVNQHHIEHCKNKTGCVAETLPAYSDSVSTYSMEMLWISDSDIMAVPEWMAKVREQLSIVYAAMGMRKESAYNRNVYFDILDATRQDLRVEQEEARLVREESLLNAMLVISALAVAAAVAFLVLYRRKIRRDYRRDIHTLRQLSDICRRMSAVATDDMEDEDDVNEAIHGLVDDKVRSLFPWLREDDWTVIGIENCQSVSCGSNEKVPSSKTSRKSMTMLDREMLHVLQVFYKWVKGQVVQAVVQQNRLRQIGSEADSMEYKYRKNKRDYILRATTVSVVNSIPAFLNRALHEIEKLDEDKGMQIEEKERRVRYLSELVRKINEYNDVLGHWIKMRQGMVSLNIETFALKEVFDMVSGNRASFESKGVALVVQSTALSVRGDKTMTLFMINTLLDNARKFTQEGGQVTLSAREEESVVTVEISDTGLGLSQADADTINNNMVYDSSRIGNASADAAMVNRNKGYGFGLMNCKAIIEKLRKTNGMFSVCKFGVRSQLGKGSVFFFSLPSKPLRALMAAFLLLVGVSCHAADAQLVRAEAFLDSVYDANVGGRYAEAVAYADSAVQCLNNHHRFHYPHDKVFMKMLGEKIGELSWWKNGDASNYELIISLRNEISIASLALQDYALYRYNNEAFTKLYTLTSTDPSLELYCKSILHANRNKKTILIIIGTFLLGCLTLFLLMHYRHHMLFVFNLHQLMRLSGGVIDSSSDSMLKVLRSGLSDIVPVESVALMEMSSEDDASHSPVTYDGDESDRKALENMMHSSLSQHERIVNAAGTMYAFPLVVGREGNTVLVGVLAMHLASVPAADEERLMMSIVVQAVAMHTYFAHYRAQEMMVRIEMMEDERQRLDMEQRKVYMRNQIVDNSLSTLKHETMYYPSRLKQMLDGVTEEGAHVFASCIKDMRNLITYYKDVYDLLASCAASQVDKSLFRRSLMTVGDVAALFRRSIERLGKCHLPPAFRLADVMPDASVMCDKDFMALLADSIVSIYLSNHGGVSRKENLRGLRLEMSSSEGFMQFALIDPSYRYEEEMLSQLFYIDGLRYNVLSDGVDGVEYMVCRQIIREHDDHSPRRGCRVYVENMADAGSRFVFTLPKA